MHGEHSSFCSKQRQGFSLPCLVSQVHQIRVGSQLTFPMQGLKAGLLLSPCQLPIPSFNLSLQFLEPTLAAELLLQIAQKVRPSGHACTHNTHFCLRALGGLPDSGVPSLKLKVWAALSVLIRSVWAMMETISHSMYNMQ